MFGAPVSKLNLNGVIYFSGLTLLGIYFLVPSFALAKPTYKEWPWASFLHCAMLAKSYLKIGSTRGQMKPIDVKPSHRDFLVFCPFLSVEKIGMSFGVWEALLTLGLLTTVIGHSLFLYSLSYFSVTTASIISSVQPLYGIVIAYFVLKYRIGACTLVVD